MIGSPGKRLLRFPLASLDLAHQPGSRRTRTLPDSKILEFHGVALISISEGHRVILIVKRSMRGEGLRCAYNDKVSHKAFLQTSVDLVIFRSATFT